ncbi:MAG TPA: M1 family aminopeptidase [Chitinophaga sp.]
MKPVRPATAFVLTCCIILLCPLLLRAQDQLHYDLQVNASLPERKFSVQGTLSFLATADVADTVVVMLSKCVAPPSIQVRTPGVRIARTDTTVNGVGDILYHMKFAKPLSPGSRIELAYTYERGGAPTFQYYIDSTFCMAGGYGSAWYPQIASRAEDGSRKYTRATGTIRVRVPSPYMPVMAASKLETGANGKIYTFRYTVPDIFSLYIAPYQRQEVKGPVPFYCFTLSKETDSAAITAKASQVLDHLVTLFGPLSIPNFSIIEFPDAVAEKTGIGGASLMGGILMPANALKRFNYALFGHEMSHQWWGNKVLSRGDEGAQMLSEGLAQYGSLQVVEAFDSSRAILYRRSGYPGYIPDQSGFGYLKNAAAGIDAPLHALTAEKGHTIGDSKGFLVLELLSNTIGKDTFHRALRTIGDKHQHSGLSWDQFLQEVEAAHGSSLQWFYDQWFKRTGAPAWETVWQQQEQELLLTLTQTDSLYRLTLEVEITYANGDKSLQRINVTERVQQLRLPVSARVTAVKIDPYFKVIHWDEELAPRARAMSKLQRVLQLRIAQKPGEAEKLALSYLAEGFPEDPYGVEFSLLYAVARLKAVKGEEDAALAYFQRALQCATRSGDLLAYTYYRIAQIAKRKKDDKLFQWACVNAVKADELNERKDDMSVMVRSL